MSESEVLIPPPYNYKFNRSFVTNFTLKVGNSIIKQYRVLGESHLLLLQLTALLFKEIGLVDVSHGQLSEILLQVGNVFQNLLEHIVAIFGCMMLEGGTLGP